MSDRRPKNSGGQKAQEGRRKAAASSSADDTEAAGPSRPTQRPPRPLPSPRAAIPPGLLASAASVAPSPPKVAIPRLHWPGDAPASAASAKAGDKHRINHACQSCRQRKTRCSGDRPVCKHCQEFVITCVYSDGKRDRLKKEFGQMASRIELYEQLLLEVGGKVDLPTRERIHRALDKVRPPADPSEMLQEIQSDEDDAPSSAPSAAAAPLDPSLPFGDPDELMDGGAEQTASAGVGSTGSVDQVREDFNMDEASRATGFMGKISDVAWLHRLRQQVRHPSAVDGLGDVEPDHAPRRPTPAASANRASFIPINASAYHCDDYEFPGPEEVDSMELPPRRTAEHLLNSYLESVHPTFPIIGKVNFTNQMRIMFEEPHLQPGPNWLAILNLIFALGAKYSHLIFAEARGDERDHLVYFTRARMLGMNGEEVLAQPTLQRVQIAGLLSFYLMSTHQINRAWIFCGMAMRYSVALGLHLRNESASLDEANKEIRYRAFWALYCLDRTLGVMTGRPISILENDVTTPLPLAAEEADLFHPATGHPRGVTMAGVQRLTGQDSSRALSTPSSHPTPLSGLSSANPTPPEAPVSGFDLFKKMPPSTPLYFLHNTRISILTGEVFVKLYCAGAMNQSWSEVQLNMTFLEARLENWRGNLPVAFDFVSTRPSALFGRQRVCLGFFYYSTRMIIHRPCLCRAIFRMPNQSKRSKAQSLNGAVLCINAARGMVELLSDTPDPVVANKHAPWWCLTHHLMQAATILMLELSFGAEHLPDESESILTAAKKVVYWLYRIASESTAAGRAWAHCNEMLRSVAPKIGRNVDEMPSDLPSFASPNYASPAMLGSGMWGEAPFGGPAPLQASYDHRQPDHYYGFQPPLYTSYNEYLPPASLDVAGSVDGDGIDGIDVDEMGVDVDADATAHGFGSAQAGSGQRYFPHPDSWPQMDETD